MPCGDPSVLIHMHRALWMWPASMRTVRAGEPGMGALQRAGGMRSIKKIVVRSFVAQAARMLAGSAEASTIYSVKARIMLQNRSRSAPMTRSQPQDKDPGFGGGAGELQTWGCAP